MTGLYQSLAFLFLFLFLISGGLFPYSGLRKASFFTTVVIFSRRQSSSRAR